MASSIILEILSKSLYDLFSKNVLDKILNAVEKPLVKRELKKALARTEERFKAITSDEEIYQAIISCPLPDLPSVADALSKFYDSPASLSLETTLNQRITEVFHHLPEEKIIGSIDNYLSILREELITISSEYRAKQDVLSNIRMEKNTGYIDSQLKNIFSLLNNFIETSRKKEEFKEQLPKLQKDLRERKNPTKLKIAIDTAQSYFGILTLPPRVQGLLIEARKYYEKQHCSKWLPWSDIEKRMNDLKARKISMDDLNEKIKILGETYQGQRKNPETGEFEVVTESRLIVAGQYHTEYKQKVGDLLEIVQMSVCPLISELPFLSQLVLSEVIRLSDGIQFQSEKHRDYKKAIEKNLIITSQEIDRYKRKLAGL